MNDDEDLGPLVRAALQAHAEDAPRSQGDAAGAARGRVRRRRRAAAVAVAVGAAVVVTAGAVVAGGAWPGSRHDPPATKTAANLPDGWRWESYGGLEVGVPGSWGWGSGSERLNQWCVGHDDAAHPDPIVGRPGPSTAVGCTGSGGGQDPATLIAHNGEFVALAPVTDGSPDGLSEEGDRTTVTSHGISVSVQATEPLRDQIVASVHAVDVDAYGCPTTDPISGDPGRRPSPAVAVGSLRDVSSISVCKYGLSYSTYTKGPSNLTRLLSSARIAGPTAGRDIRAIAAEPTGGGPDRPGDCVVGVGFGDEAIVLRIESAGGLSEVYLRYSGCDHNGFDDGTDLYRLSATSLPPFVAGPNAVLSYSGPPSKGIR